MEYSKVGKCHEKMVTNRLIFTETRLTCYSDIIKRFDVCAVQEVTGNLRALRDMMKYLDDEWSFLMTDVTAGTSGNKERLAYIFRSTRVQPSGLACKIVIAPE